MLFAHAGNMVLKARQPKPRIPLASRSRTHKLQLREHNMPVSCTKFLPTAILPCCTKFVAGVSFATVATPIVNGWHCVSKWTRIPLAPLFKLDTVDKLASPQARAKMAAALTY
jgi:hypothetical protein